MGIQPIIDYPSPRGERIMMEKRSKGQRRWGLDHEFPVKDSNGVVVVTDRRRLTDRRLDNTSLEDRLMMFSEMPAIDIEHIKND
jgi:hypothetical protein